MNDHKNFYETMFEGKYQINESSVLEDEKKGIFLNQMKNGLMHLK